MFWLFKSASELKQSLNDNKTQIQKFENRLSEIRQNKDKINGYDANIDFEMCCIYESIDKLKYANKQIKRRLRKKGVTV